MGILRENDIATIVVTHDREEGFAIADRIGVMNDGRLGAGGHARRRLSHARDAFVAKMAGASDFIAGEVGTDWR